MHRICFLQCWIYCSHKQPHCNSPFSFSFQRFSCPSMPGNGYRKKKSPMKPCKKQMLQGTTAIDEHPRKCLPVSHSKPDCHSQFFYEVFKLFNSPRVVISQCETKRAKCEMQSCLPRHALEERVGQFQMRKRRRGRDRGQVLLQTYILKSF